MLLLNIFTSLLIYTQDLNISTTKKFANKDHLLILAYQSPLILPKTSKSLCSIKNINISN